MRSFRSFANDDRHVMAKHSSIYPAPEELEAVQTLVSTVEGALKKVSDWMDGLNKSSGKTSANDEARDSKVEEDAAETKPDSTPALCGVTRVGLVAKGLLIKGDMDLELVLMCREKPTKLLLYTVSANLPLQIQTMTEDKYEVQSCVPEAAIRVCSTKDPRLTLKITLSSLTMREDHSTTQQEDGHPDDSKEQQQQQQEEEEKEDEEEEDILDRQKCRAALAALRHAKWFQARVTDLKSCVIILRIFRDMCSRLAGWQPLKGWPLELICEKAIATCNRPLGPGEALRRVMECIASGILLPGDRLFQGQAVFPLYSAGVSVAGNCRSCPRTYRTLLSLRTFISSNSLGSAGFWLLGPGATLGSSYGPTNTRLRCHLGLQTPALCELVVGGEPQCWSEGHCLLVDDSFLHTVSHKGPPDAGPRVILSVDLWHPNVAAAERQALDFMFNPDL